MLRYLSLAAVLLLAGCLNAEDAPAEGGDDVATAAVDAAEPQNAVVEAEAAESAAIALLVTPIEYSGSTPVGVCNFIVGQCEWANEGTEDFHMLGLQGAAQWLSVAFEFSGQAPGMQFYAAVCPAEAEGGDGCSEYVTGPSPLLLEVDLTQFPAGTDLGISVGSLNQEAAQSGTMVFGAADFTVVGTATSMPPTA